MKILIPMAGAGQRFRDAGYKTHKPAIPVTDRRSGEKIPMVVAATMDLPGVAAGGANVCYIDRDFHKIGGVEEKILAHYPKARFLTLDHLTEGQASTCLTAKAEIDDADSLLIAGCDNGMVIDEEAFQKACQTSDCLVFTYRHNESVLRNPDAYGWMRVDETGRITGCSIKKAISAHPLEDHAVVATFWFRHGHDFVRAAEKMIAEDDRIHGEFYVDEVVKHILALGLCAHVFEVERYIGWGTPADYEAYEKTLAYWRGFVTSRGFRPKDKS